MTKDGKRLRILSKKEQQALYDLPSFNEEERELYFQFFPEEKTLLEFFKTKESKIYLLLQLGYFKARSMFFECQLSENNPDVQYILKQYFSDITFSTLSVSKSNRFLIQSRILNLFSWKRFDKKAMEQVLKKTKKLVTIFVDPRYIFSEILEFLDSQQIVMPGYSTLQKIVGKVLLDETKRLNTIMKQNFSKSIYKDLEEMLKSNEQKMYGITLLKHDAKGFNHKEIVKEISKRQASQVFYKAAKDLIPKLGISERNIRYYAYLVDYYTVDRLKELTDEAVLLYLLCYIYYRFERINDNLIQSFIYHLNRYKNAAKIYSKDAVYDYRIESKKYGKKAGEIFDLLIYEKVSDDQIRPSAFQIVDKENFPLLKAHVTQNIDEEAFRWDYYKKNNKIMIINLRPIIRVLEFSSDITDHPLIQAITFLKNVWKSKKTLNQIKQQHFPTRFIPREYVPYLYEIDKKNLNVDAYEFMVYNQLVNVLESQTVFVSDSFSFKSLTQDLLPDWDDNKNNILAQLSNPVLNTPITEQLRIFEEELEPFIVEINQNIDNKTNKEIKIKLDKNDPTILTWTLPYANQKEEINNPFYNQLPKVSLSKVMRFVDNCCHFTKAFTHIKPQFAKITEFDIEAIFGILTAYSTNYGIYQMAGICDIGYAKLSMTAKRLFRLETLINANNILRQATAELPIFKEWDLLENTKIASLDGKKIQTRFKHIMARFSTKYFGQKQGVVSHSLNYNNMCVNSKVHGANEHESHYSYELFYNSVIEADWYCGDTHSINQMQYLLFHLKTKKFTPHIKKIQDKAKDIISFKDPSGYVDFLIKPEKQLNKKLIKKEWDGVQHILASMLMGNTNHSVVVKKLSTHKRKTKTQQAAWEYNKILQSMHILKFIDDPVYRQAIRGALNRVEGYNQLLSKIGGINGGKFRGATESELMIWNECQSLVANIVIYYNTLILSKIYQMLKAKGETEKLEFVKRLSPIAWGHIILDGYYQFRDVSGSIDLEEMLNNLQFDKRRKKK